MGNHRAIVARGFRIGGWVLGVPSLAALAAICINLFLLRPAPNKSSDLAIGTYGIAGLLANGARGIGRLFDWLGSIATWIEEALAIGLIGAVLFAVMLYSVSRGIERHSATARIVAFVVSCVFLLFWLALMFFLPREVLALAGLGVGLSLYTIWVLGWRYDG
jgi:hypothetical protein